VIAVAAGAAATVSPLYAAALVVGVALLALVGATIDTLPVFLIFTMFAESAALGPGVRIGRIAGALALLVIVLYVLQRGTRGLRVSALLVFAGLTGLWMCVSGLWAVSGSLLATSFARWVLAAAYMTTFAVLVRTKRQFMITFGALAVGSLVFGLISFYGYMKQGSTYLDEGIGATGGSSDHNYFAVYQVVALPAVLALTVLDRNRPRRILWFGVLGVIVLSVAASLSRTGLIALVGAVLLTLLLPWRIFFRRRTQKLSYVAALAVAVAAVGLAGESTFVKRAQTIFQPSAVAGHAGSGRIDLWSAAWLGYKQHPLLGLGAGGFPARSIQLIQEAPRADTSAEYALQPMVVHNMYLEVLTELGPVGEAILLGLLFCLGRILLVVFRRGRRAHDRDIETISIALLVSLVAYCVSGFFLSIEANKPLWILVGLALALDVMTRQLPVPAVELEAPVAAARALYDRPVRGPAKRDTELDPRLEEQVARVTAEREKLERRNALLDLRTKRLEVREAALVARAAALGTDVPAVTPPVRQERPQVDLDAREEDLVRREALLERRIAAVTVREGDVVKRAAELARRSREAPPAPPPAPVVSVPEPPAAPEPVEVESAVESEAPVEVVQPSAPSASGVSIYNLEDLERAVQENAGHERAEEWAYYLLYLRDYAAVDGTLPSSFDALVDDVFAELVDA
jgi:O-antigen ligase